MNNILNSQVKGKPLQEENKETENGTNGDVTDETPSKKRKTAGKNNKTDTPVSTSKTVVKEKEKRKANQQNGENGDEAYEVEKIVDVKTETNGKRKFLVKWKNYSSENNTWEPESNLACDELISEFLKTKEKVADPTKNKNKNKISAEDSTDYEVQKILDVNYKSNNKREFLIRWKNYSSKHDTWEPEENLSCDELIAAFLENEEKRAKASRSSLREKPKKVSKYESPGSKRTSRRIAGGNRK